MTLYAVCKQIGAVTPGYKFGGGHDRPISQVRGSQPLDCSSSVSRALYLAGLFGNRKWSLDSRGFAGWGKPGRGKDWTVHHRWNHVWIEFHGKHAGWRFDTSPWGVGGRGPRLRHSTRPTDAFQQRHMPGH